MSCILHASLPADDPARVARVLSELMGGRAMPFPPAGSSAWVAWANDGHTEIEVVPRGDELIMGSLEAEWRPCRQPRRHSEIHLALAVPLDCDRILSIARREGWPARLCDRGGLFELIELWVEDSILIELFDPQMACRFDSAISSERWEALLCQGAPQAA